MSGGAGTGVVREWEVGEASASERTALLARERELFGAGSALRAEWLFDRNPAGQAVVIVARDAEGGILGTRALLPWRVLVDGRETLVGQYARSWTEPAFRRQGVSVAIGRELNRRSRELGYPLVFLFPSVRSIPGHRRLGNRLVTTLERRQLPGSARFFLPGAPRFLDAPVRWVRHVRGRAARRPDGERVGPARWVPEPEPALSAGRFWESRAGSSGVVGIRDAAFVTWRYSPESGRDYAAWRYPDSGETRLVAFVHRAQGARARILELLGPAEGEERAAALAGLAEQLVAGGAHLVEWCPPRHGSDPAVADRAGFFRRRTGVPLGLWYNRPETELGALGDPARFRLTEGDSDYA